MLKWIKSLFEVKSPYSMTVEDYYRVEGIHPELYENKQQRERK